MLAFPGTQSPVAGHRGGDGCGCGARARSGACRHCLDAREVCKCFNQISSNRSECLVLIIDYYDQIK